MLQIDGVLSVHELHCWSIRGTDAVLSAHVVAGQGASGARVRAETEAVLRERYGIVHTTLQVEHRGDDDCAAPACP
jgi:cobalt-zinc-cadmium efflux system protein